MPEYRTHPLSKVLLLDELQFICAAMQKHEIATVPVSFEWDSNLPIAEMWKEDLMPGEEVIKFVNAAERAGTIEVSKADIFLEGTNFSFTR